MSVTLFSPGASPDVARDISVPRLSPHAARMLLLCIVVLALAAGLVVTPQATVATAVEAAGTDLTRLLRAMAAIKVLFAAGATAAILWRFGGGVSAPWFVAYAVACCAMAAGPGLIWGVAHTGLGAALLHGGLFAAIVLLWRDPGVGARLSEMIAARRALLRTRGT
jgi:hypothetical protein